MLSGVLFTHSEIQESLTISEYAHTFDLAYRQMQPLVDTTLGVERHTHSVKMAADQPGGGPLNVLIVLLGMSTRGSGMQQHRVKCALLWPRCSAVLLLTLTIGTFHRFSTVKQDDGLQVQMVFSMCVRGRASGRNICIPRFIPDFRIIAHSLLRYCNITKITLWVSAPFPASLGSNYTFCCCTLKI